MKLASGWILALGALTGVLALWTVLAQRDTAQSGSSLPRATASLGTSQKVVRSVRATRLSKDSFKAVQPVVLRQASAFQAPAGPPGTITPEVRTLAESHDSEAMAYLASALHRCYMATRSDEEIIDSAAKLSMRMEGGMARAGTQVSESALKMSADQAQADLDARGSCADVPADDIAKWREWMLKAASAGDTSARLQLAWTLADAYPVESRTDDNDNYLDDRDFVFDGLIEEIRVGNCSDSVLGGLVRVSADDTDKYVFMTLLLNRGLALLAGQTMDADAYQRERSAIESARREVLGAVPPGGVAKADEFVAELVAICR